VIARDEQANLAELLPTLDWADERLVLIDAATSDASFRVAQQHADRVESCRFISFPQMRNHALSLAHGDWVLFVDADERLSESLVAEVRAAVNASERRMQVGETAPVGYWIPRHNLIFGRLVRGGGWSPDYQLRLLRRLSARYDEARLVHEQVLLDGPSDHLHERLLHFNYASLRQFGAKQRQYTRLEAEELRAQGVHFRRRALVGQPLRELGRRYLALGGWRDGAVGLILALAMSYYAFQRVRLVRRGAS
jgi:glycosyltransferase involved in cell wall biosynthesis